MTSRKPFTSTVATTLRIAALTGALTIAALPQVAAADAIDSNHPQAQAVEASGILSRIEGFFATPSALLPTRPNAINPAARFRASWTRLQAYKSQESGGDEIYLLYALLRKGSAQVIPSLSVASTGYLSGLNTGDIRTLNHAIMTDQALSGPLAISYVLVEADDSGTGNITSAARSAAQTAFNQALTQGIGDPCGLASRVSQAMAGAVDNYDKWLQDDDERIGSGFRWCFSQGNLESMTPGFSFNANSRHTGNSGDYRVDLQLRRTQ